VTAARQAIALIPEGDKRQALRLRHAFAKAERVSPEARA
jgi:hypothetical protein